MASREQAREGILKAFQLVNELGITFLNGRTQELDNNQWGILIETARPLDPILQGRLFVDGIPIAVKDDAPMPATNLTRSKAAALAATLPPSPTS